MARTMISGLRCEYGAHPIAVDVDRPRFSWRMIDPPEPQRAYEIEVAPAETGFTEESAIWRSGRVESNESAWVRYGGPTLSPMTRYVWRVRIWYGAQARSPWSPDAWFETGRRETPWAADWIQAPDDLGAGLPLLRRDLRFGSSPVRARLYVTALGLYECRINGVRVGRDELRPGWTDYSKRVVYDTYDVTAAFERGDNTIGVMLAPGWYCGRIAWFGSRLYGDRPSVLAELRVTLSDGQEQIIGTDRSWRCHPGPVKEADLLDGELYDATCEQRGWDRPGFGATGWSSAVCLGGSTPSATVAPVAPPVRVVERRQMDEIARGTAFRRYDLGQNVAGRIRVALRGERGARVRIRHAEMLQQDGSLYVENLRSARATDTYVLSGDETEAYEPRFTFHGFRYVEIVLPEDRHVDVVSVEAAVLHNDMTSTGAFECSDALVNRLFANLQWGQRGNYLEVPTDCPQRDERLGWTGDAQVFAPTACYNMDVSGFFAKWMQDLRDAQGADGRYPKYAPDPEGARVDGGPGWADAGIICAWRSWLHYGDVDVLEDHFDSMRRFAAFLDDTSADGIRPIERPGVRLGYGDWLALDGGEGRRGATPLTLVGTAYHVRAVDLLVKIANLLGHTKDAMRWRRQATVLRSAFQRRFVGQDAVIEGNTQTGYLLALGFDLLPDESRGRAFQHLVERVKERDYHLSTGFLGTPLLCPVLSRFGRSDLAYRILMQRTYPGWLYSVLQGATTMWERWDSYTKEGGFGPADMNSFNHYAYGAIGQWMYETILGISPNERGPGFRVFDARPVPGGGLEYARGHVDTPYGRIEASWRIEGSAFHYELSVPPSTTARLVMPFATDLSSDQEDVARDRGGRPRLSLSGGVHRISQHIPAR